MYMSKKRVDDGTFYGPGIAPMTAVSQSMDNMLRELFMEEKMSHLPACLEFERKTPPSPIVKWMEDDTKYSL